jgi:hypothetical protein
MRAVLQTPYGKPTSEGGKQVPLFPIIDWASVEPEDSGRGYKTEFVALEGEAGDILPVFTSANRCKAFVDDYFACDDITQPSTFPMDVFRLAEMMSHGWRRAGWASCSSTPR